ncbi:MAG: glycosyltransferase, partial [Candidatus Omnitrophica bacterium]|nr:glycosyltransferase [Candidatus Omnitrophota bacterium]
GDGPLRNSLERKVEEMNLSKRVDFLGMRDDLDVVYGDLDLSVLTSKNEGLPVALIEALASGTPIVGSDVGATHELKHPSWGSGIYPPGNIDELVTCILEGYRRRSDYELITREMKSEIIRRYSIDRLVNDIDALYRSLCSSHGI